MNEIKSHKQTTCMYIDFERDILNDTLASQLEGADRDDRGGRLPRVRGCCPQPGLLPARGVSDSLPEKGVTFAA